MKLGLFAVLVLAAFTLSCGTPTDEKVVFSVRKGMKGAYVAFIVATPATVQRGSNDNELAQQSLAYVRKQLENKTYLFSGPIMDNDRVRGIVIVNTASEEHARGAERRPHDQKWQSSFRIASDGIPEHATGDALKYT